MVEESKGPKRRMPEDFVSRFRSKEDLYRYLTQQGKIRHGKWILIQQIYSCHRCTGPKWASCAIFSARQSCVLSRMRSIEWKCRPIKRYQSRTCMLTRSRMSCLWSTCHQRSNSRGGCQSESSSSVYCALWGTSTWRTSLLKLINRDTQWLRMTPKSKALLYLMHGSQN